MKVFVIIYIQGQLECSSSSGDLFLRSAGREPCWNRPCESSRLFASHRRYLYQLRTAAGQDEIKAFISACEGKEVTSAESNERANGISQVKRWTSDPSTAPTGSLMVPNVCITSVYNVDTLVYVFYVDKAHTRMNTFLSMFCHATLLKLRAKKWTACRSPKFLFRTFLFLYSNPSSHICGFHAFVSGYDFFCFVRFFSLSSRWQTLESVSPRRHLSLFLDFVFSFFLS